MKRRSVILISILTAAMLAACGGSGSNAGTAMKQGDGSGQTAAAGSTEDGNNHSEAGAVEAASGDNVRTQILDPGAVYQEGEFILSDEDRYQAAVSGYMADEDSFSVKLKIENKAESEYSYSVYGVSVNHGLVNFEIKDSTGSDIDELKAGSGEELEACIRIPAAEFGKYNLTAADELRFTIAGYPEVEEDYDYTADIPAELAYAMEEPEGLEEADAGVTAGQEAAEPEDRNFSKEFCVYPTGKEGKEITPVRIDTEDEFEWFIQNDQLAFGVRKSLDEQMTDSRGAVGIYLENKSDKDLDFILEKITVNGMPMLHAETETSDLEEGAVLKSVSSIQQWRTMPAGTICLADMLTDDDLEENGIEKIYDLKSVLKVKDENFKDIETEEINYHFQDADSSTAGTADPAASSESASPYVKEAAKAGESDLYKLTVTGYDQNDLAFIVHCEMQNKAEKAYRYDFYTSNWEINRHFIEDEFDRGYLSDIDNSVEVEGGKTALCDIVIPATSLQAFGIDRVEELQFVVSGKSVEDEEAMWAAFDEENFSFEEKDGSIYDTVTVHPTGKTDEEINESISVTEKDCAAYVDGDGFSMGILKDVQKDDPYGDLMVYFENKTNEELYVTLEEITINGEPFTYKTDYLEEASSRQITLRLPANTKGYKPILSSHELEENGIDSDIKEFACSVYHKEHPAQGSQFASYAEKITCSFSN